MNLDQIKDFFNTCFFPEKKHVINDNEPEVTSRKFNVLGEIEKNQEINTNKEEFSNKQIEISNVYTSYIQMFLLERAILPQESIPFPFNNDDPSRLWAQRFEMWIPYFIRPIFNSLWFEFTEEDWSQYIPHSNIWIVVQADYSICLFNTRLGDEPDQIYYNSLDLFEQSLSFQDTKDIKLEQTNLILTSKEHSNTKIFSQLIKYTQNMNYFSRDFNFKSTNYTNVIQSLSYSPIQQSANSNSWFSITTPPDVVPFFIANDIQTSLIFFNVLESGLIILTGFIFIFFLLRLHNLIFWYLDSFTEQDLSEFRQIVKISAPLLLTCIRYFFVSIELILIIIVVYNLWSYVPFFFLPPSLFFPNFQTPKDSLIRGFDYHNFNRIPVWHEDYKAFRRFRPFSMYYAPVPRFWYRFEGETDELVWLRSTSFLEDSELESIPNTKIYLSQTPAHIGPAQYLFLQQIAGFDWFRENLEQNFHLKFISRFKVENKTRFPRYSSEDDLLLRKYYPRKYYPVEKPDTQFEQCLRLLFPRYSVVREAYSKEDFLKLDIEYKDRTFGAYFLSIFPQGGPNPFVVDPELLSDIVDDFEERFLDRFVKFRHSYNVIYGNVPLYMRTLHRDAYQEGTRSEYETFNEYPRSTRIFSNIEKTSFWGQTRSYFLVPIEIMVSMLKKILSKEKKEMEPSFFSQNNRYQKVHTPYETRQYFKFANDTKRPFPFMFKNLPIVRVNQAQFAKFNILYHLRFLRYKSKEVVDIVFSIKILPIRTLDEALYKTKRPYYEPLLS